MHSRVWHSNHMNNTHIFKARELGTNEFCGEFPENISASLHSKGIGYFFREGDLIQIEDSPITRYDGFVSQEGRQDPIISVRAFCERWGEFMLPLGLLYKTPLDEVFEEGQTVTEREQFLQDNPLGQQICIRMTDRERRDILSGKTIKILSVYQGHGYAYKDGQRTDRIIPRKCYKTAIVE